MARVFFVVEGQRYEMVSLSDVTIKDIIAIQRQTGMGIGRLEELLAETGTMTGDQVVASPDHLTAFGVQIWLARRAVDPGLTFDEGIDFPFADLDVVIEGAEEDAEAVPQ